jgi:hypothetical protein
VDALLEGKGENGYLVEMNENEICVKNYWSSRMGDTEEARAWVIAIESEKETCPFCDGDYWHGEQCSHCDGTGFRDK